MEELITGPEVSRFYRISRSTLNRWRRLGKIAPVALSSRTLRYRRADVLALLDGKAATQ